MTRWDVVKRFSWEQAFHAWRNIPSNFQTIIQKGQVYPFNVLRSALDFLWKTLKQQGALKSPIVVLPAFLCPVVVETVLRNNLTPRLVDVHLDDFNLNETSENFPTNVGATLVSHTFGFPYNVESLKPYRPGILIEDAAHAWTTTLHGKPVGFDGDYGLFSLYKQVGNWGGGLLWSRDFLDAAYKGVPYLHRNGKDFFSFLWKLEGVHQILADILRKHRISKTSEVPSELHWEICKASPAMERLFLEQWDALVKGVEERKRIAEALIQRLDPNRFTPQKLRMKEGSPSWPFLTIRLNEGGSAERDRLWLKLRKHGVFADRLWHNAAAVQPAYQEYFAGSCQNARRLAHTVINLPLPRHFKEKDLAWYLHLLHT